MSPSGRRAPPRFDFQIAKDYDPFSIRSSEANIVILDAPGVSPPGAFLFVRESCGLVLIRLLYVNFGSVPLLGETADAAGASPGRVISPVSGQNGGASAEDSMPLGSKSGTPAQKIKDAAQMPRQPCRSSRAGLQVMIYAAIHSTGDNADR